MLSTGPGRIGSSASACSGVSSASLSGANRGLVSRISSLRRLSRALPSGYLSGPGAAMLTEAMAKRITLDFLKTESASGVILAAAAVAAIALANSPWAHAYFGFIAEPFTVQLGAFTETLSILDWVKEGLMAVFFFAVGPGVKYESVRGEPAHPRPLALPGIAAPGGLVGARLIYLAVNACAG